MYSSPLTLRLFRSASGSWSGTMLCAGDDIAGIGGCLNPEEVLQAAVASDLHPDRIEFENAIDRSESDPEFLRLVG